MKQENVIYLILANGLCSDENILKIIQEENCLNMTIKLYIQLK